MSSCLDLDPSWIGSHTRPENSTRSIKGWRPCPSTDHLTTSTRHHSFESPSLKSVKRVSSPSLSLCVAGNGRMDAVDSVVDPLRDFAKDSVRLVKRCHKPDRKEFTKVAFRTAIGFVVMGFVGFFVKLIFIPINNIIVGSG
ncbi:hypothetical protein BT93_B0024 [Corymbia citriodora subsp. variegata]|nr:hypothetical protein BT93_B0024 [Corymbia citriodora subsp. variegata]